MKIIKSKRRLEREELEDRLKKMGNKYTYTLSPYNFFRIKKKGIFNFSYDFYYEDYAKKFYYEKFGTKFFPDEKELIKDLEKKTKTEVIVTLK